jgi:MraZ protein
MAIFLSTYHNKLDKKGRVSVPSQFREIIKKENFDGIVVYPSVINNCIEGCCISRIEKISNSIDQLDPLSEERDAFASVILGSSVQLTFDSEGRVIIPKELLQTFDISENVVFIGKGQTFELWNPVYFDEYLAKAKKIAIEKRNALRS